MYHCISEREREREQNIKGIRVTFARQRQHRRRHPALPFFHTMPSSGLPLEERSQLPAKVLGTKTKPIQEGCSSLHWPSLAKSGTYFLGFGAGWTALVGNASLSK